MIFNSIPAGELIQETMLHNPPLDKSNVNFASVIVARVLRFTNINFRRYAMRVAKITIYIFFLAVLFLVIRMPEPIHAQETPNREATTVDDGKLRSFAKVYVQVEKIRQTYGPQLKETQDPQKNMEIQKEAKSKIDAALAQEGMTVDSYSQVVQTMNGNDELRKKAIEFIDQERTKP
jgi:hypothetical protein